MCPAPWSHLSIEPTPGFVKRRHLCWDKLNYTVWYPCVHVWCYDVQSLRLVVVIRSCLHFDQARALMRRPIKLFNLCGLDRNCRDCRLKSENSKTLHVMFRFPGIVFSRLRLPSTKSAALLDIYVPLLGTLCVTHESSNFIILAST